MIKRNHEKIALLKFWGLSKRIRSCFRCLKI